MEPPLVVYTSIMGGRHRLIDPTVITPDCRYVCFTDQPHRSEIWEIVRVPSGDDPRRASRYYKMKPHLLFDVEYSIWIDAAFRINVDLRLLIRRYLTRASIAAFSHWARDCTFEHGDHHIAIGMGGDPDVIRRQMSRYRSEGLPELAGLWNCGALLRRHTREINALNDDWWRELETGGDRDELSFGYLTWRRGIPVATMPGHTLRNAELEHLGPRGERHSSEFDPAEWDRLVPPRSLSSFPADLTNTALEYRGIYVDGWLDDSVLVGLDHPKGPAHLVVRGMVPLIDGPEFTSELHVLVDNREIARLALGLGDFEVVESVPPGAGRRHIRLHFSNGQVLPGENAPRRVAAQLRFIGFEASTLDELPTADSASSERGVEAPSV